MRCAGRKGDDQMRIARQLVAAMSVMVAIHALAPTPSVGFHQDPPLVPEPPFVVCQDQRYALCAAASCFVYNAVAYCQCDVLSGDSISLQFDVSTPTGEQNVCDVNAQGKT